MKKLLTLSLMLGAMTFAVPSAAEAKTTTAAVESPQIRVQIGRNARYRNRRVRTYTTTRIVRRGFRTFRETVRTTYLPNGRTSTQVVSRVRIR